ncbi:MAG: hypothetical protein HYV52_00985 [Parcubacteria group bacterium]|nr:hypothetical protein [Parcubacteria group bacterium]
MNKDQNSELKNGFGLVEIIVAVGLLAGAIFAITELTFFLNRTAKERTVSERAVFLTKEGLELTRTIRDRGWTNYIANQTIGIDLHPVLGGTPAGWSFASGTETIDNIFVRKIVLSNVNRDSQDNIVLTGGVLDPGTKKVIATVSWGVKKIEFTAYITNFLNN